MQTVASSQEQDEETTVKTTRLPNAEIENLENADFYEDCWEKAPRKHKEKQDTTGAANARRAWSATVENEEARSMIEE